MNGLTCDGIDQIEERFCRSGLSWCTFMALISGIYVPVPSRWEWMQMRFLHDLKRRRAVNRVKALRYMFSRFIDSSVAYVTGFSKRSGGAMYVYLAFRRPPSRVWRFMQIEVDRQGMLDNAVGIFGIAMEAAEKFRDKYDAWAIEKEKDMLAFVDHSRWKEFEKIHERTQEILDASH